MAAGIPVVVSDWDGYKDTVRDGVDGFRIPTFKPMGSDSIGVPS
jgi:glycosyltransferase involved in cell wall biosynthesis